MSANTLAALIRHSIRVHDAQQDDAGVAEHALDTLSGSAYEMLRTTYDLHNDFVTMLRCIVTKDRSAEEIMEQIRDLMTALQERLSLPAQGSREQGDACTMAVTAFVTELGAILTSEEEEADQGDAPAAVPVAVGDTLIDRIIHATSVHEASGESATLLRGIYIDEGQSDEKITAQLRALQVEIQQTINRFLGAPDRAVRRAAAEALLTEIDAIIAGPGSGPDEDAADDGEDYQEFSPEEIIEDRAVNEAHRLLHAASPLQSTPWISRLVGDVARASVAIARQPA